MSSIIQIKRGKTAEWPPTYVLQQGEYGVDMGSKNDPVATDFKIKIGDGVTQWSSLPEISGGGGTSTIDNIDGGHATSNYGPGSPLAGIDAGGA